MVGTLENAVGISEEVIKMACSLSVKAHSGKHPFTKDTRATKHTVFFAFAGSGSVQDWFPLSPLNGATNDLNRFPSLKSISVDDKALVNGSFRKIFDGILGTPSLENEVGKALKDNKLVVFTGHSSGGPIAILATLYFLEKRRKLVSGGSPQSPPRCVTFGSPLLGDRIISHSLEREKWSQYFVHFVTRYDIVPRISLSPLSNIKNELVAVQDYLEPNSKVRNATNDFTTLYEKVMTNASSVTSYAASRLKGCTNLLLETLTSFTELSLYRPSGTYVFCTGSEKLTVVKNTDAVLQLLFYSAQLRSEQDLSKIAKASLEDHFAYGSVLKDSLNKREVVILDNENLQDIPLSSNASGDVNSALNDLGLSTNARLCLRAAGELQKQKAENKAKIDSKKKEIDDNLKDIEKYQQVRKICYYDSFKQSNDEEDFLANISRLKLAGIWDEISEMLKRCELPDGFEVDEEWIKLGTRFRRLVEPLDIANYYRHAKNEDTGSYEIRGRPKRYRFAQRWLEHALKKKVGESSESCFWAKVEEYRVKERTAKAAPDSEVLKLQEDACRWIDAEELGKDVFIKGSTFMEWWNNLSANRKFSSLAARLQGEASNRNN